MLGCATAAFYGGGIAPLCSRRKTHSAGGPPAIRDSRWPSSRWLCERHRAQAQAQAQARQLYPCCNTGQARLGLRCAIARLVFLILVMESSLLHIHILSIFAA